MFYPVFSRIIYRIFLIIVLFAGLSVASADVVKPALTEINVYADGRVLIEIRTSLEALLSGIDGQYRNTQEAPTADLYDKFRVQPAQELQQSFESFHDDLLEGVSLTLEQQPVQLDIESIEIPEPGYTKVPRTSVITLRGQIFGDPAYLQWYYPARFGDHAVRVKLVDESRDFWYWSDYQWIRQDKVSEPFRLQGLNLKPAWYAVAYTYTEAGFLHILPKGTDHILFVIGLLLMSRTLRPLLWQVTMFTLAHSITLSLSTLGIFALPAALVEPLIALSIAFVAIQNIFYRVVKRSRLSLIFAFGLLHGLGFAAMLKEFGLPEDSFLLALFSFNIGVELGQVTILLGCWISVVIWLRGWHGYRHYFIIPASILIAVTGLLWFWQRLDWRALISLV
jgi:hypothetical protein